MNIIVCLDDDNGMMFNNRRQSRDRSVIEDIIKLTSRHKLYINKYSEPLFKDTSAKYTVDDTFLSNAERGDYCFIENVDASNYIYKTETITIYRWNRKYPNDFAFKFSLDKWRLDSVAEFAGNSHDKITREIYINEKV